MYTHNGVYCVSIESAHDGLLSNRRYEIYKARVCM